jgi:hypothetical protein
MLLACAGRQPSNSHGNHWQPCIMIHTLQVHASWPGVMGAFNLKARAASVSHAALHSPDMSGCMPKGTPCLSIVARTGSDGGPGGCLNTRPVPPIAQGQRVQSMTPGLQAVAASVVGGGVCWAGGGGVCN